MFNRFGYVIDYDKEIATYTVQVYRGRGLKMREIKAVSGVYCDTLREVFEAETGLRCTL